MSGCSSCGDNYLNYCLKLLCEETPPTQTCDAGYIYNLEKTTTVDVPAGNYVKFLEPALTKGGITHDNVTTPDQINIANTGLYEVIFYVNGGSTSVVGLEINSAITIPPMLTYRNNSNEAIYGHALIEITQPNSILKVKALTDLDLNKTTDDFVCVNASVIIKKICV